MLYLTYYDPIKFNNLINIKQKINIMYPFANQLLYKFKGDLIVAGGAIVKAIYDNYSRTDIDFFFYNLDVGQSNRLKIEAVEYLFSRLKFHVERDQYVTTVKAEFIVTTINKQIVVY